MADVVVGVPGSELSLQAESLRARKVVVADKIRELAAAQLHQGDLPPAAQESVAAAVTAEFEAAKQRLEEEYVLLNRALVAITRIERQTNEPSD